MEGKLLANFLAIQTNNIKPEQGKILISEPFNQDFHFKRSVILLTEYSEKGATGFVLNNETTQNISDVITDFPPFDAKIYYGGPVGKQNLFYIHTLGQELLPDSLHIFENVYWGGNYKQLKELINQGLVDNTQIKFFVGYSGWSPKQLEAEIEKDYWLVETINPTEIINSQEALWKKILNTLEPKYQNWTNFPENPTFN